MAAVNRILPEKVDNYKVIKFGDYKIKCKNAKNIPETNIGIKDIYLLQVYILCLILCIQIQTELMK